MDVVALKKAKKLLEARRFPEVIKLLEPLVIDHKDSFQFYYILGTACLYVGDIGGAELYYKRARNIKLLDVDLIIAQAVLYLRRGEIGKAVEYYLEAQEYDKNNKIAQKALVFIKKNSTSEKMLELVQSGKIRRFYPNLGMHPRIIGFSVICLVCTILGTTAFFVFKPTDPLTGTRANISELALTSDEKNNATEQDIASFTFRYVLTQKEIEVAYLDAQRYFQSYRDNAARVEINRILNSNASTSIRQKARLLAEYLEEPTFDTAIEHYTYEQIQNDPFLYLDCWVIWGGRVTNVQQTPTEYRCDFLIGYDTLQKIDGIVSLVLQEPVSIDTTQPLQVLAQISVENGRVLLRGKSIYQPIANTN